MTRLFTALFACLVVLLGCSKMNVTSQHADNVDFSHYKTWNWLPEPAVTPAPTDSTITDPAVLVRIEKAIENQLIAQGYRKTSDAPDFFVKYFAALRTNLSQTTVDDRYDDASYAGYTQDWQTDYTHVWHQGSLLIDVLDAKSAKLVWRGYASTELKPNASYQEREKRVQDAVAKILKTFPPKTK